MMYDARPWVYSLKDVSEYMRPVMVDFAVTRSQREQGKRQVTSR